MNEADIFLAATQIDDPQLRQTFLRTVCEGDAALRGSIEARLQQFEAWNGKLDRFREELPARVERIRLEENERTYAATGSRSIQPGFATGHRFRQYRVDGCLGVGGMGEVYLATDERLGRQVALKVLPIERMGDAHWIERFESEARAISALNHPNVLTIHEIGNDNDFYFMVTEYIQGQTLRQMMSAQPATPSALILSALIPTAIGIARGLAAAHEAGILHRDLKPENVMIRSDGLVKVVDFGLAKHLEPSQSSVASALNRQTEPGLLLGTVRYMSPEQVRRQRLDYRSDIFSLGVILYEWLIGQLPFKGLSDADVVTAILREEPHQLTAIAPPELRQLIEAMLCKDRQQRTLTAPIVVEHLTNLADGLRALKPMTRSEIASSNDSSTASREPWEVPEVFYARSGDVNIAYQVLGQGDIDVVFVMGWVSHLEWFWNEPSFARFLNKLASFARLILFDKRGTGLSDKVPSDKLPTLEQRMDDLRAVMQAVGSERAVLCGVSEGGPMCSLFAATYPQKTTALIMIGSYARRLRSDDYPWGPTADQHEHFLNTIRDQWGGPVGIEARAPSQATNPEFRKWWASYLRMGASPGAALALTRMNAQVDIRPILRSIQVPTLVIHRTGDQCLLVEEGRYLADNIPGALFVELPGNDHLPFVGSQEQITSAIEVFLTGVKHHSHIKRVLATVLVAEFLPGNDTASPIAATRIETARAHFAREIVLYRGKQFATHLEYVIGTFDGPARAIRAAMAMSASARRLGALIRIGIHTGECDEREEAISGPALESATSVKSHASAGQIFVSGTVKDLVAGADFHFEFDPSGNYVVVTG